MRNCAVYSLIGVLVLLRLLSVAVVAYATPDTDGILQKVVTEQPETTKEKHMPALTAGEVLVFISFSMPEASVQQWLQQAQRIHATVVLRGLVNGDLADTQAKLQAVTPTGEGGAVIDPHLFTDYQVTVVPTVVVRDTQALCSATQACAQEHPFDRVSGNVGLEAALAAIAARPDHVAALARHALQLLRDGP